jgi:hypothetical protein
VRYVTVGKIPTVDLTLISSNSGFVTKKAFTQDSVMKTTLVLLFVLAAAAAISLDHENALFANNKTKVTKATKPPTPTKGPAPTKIDPSPVSHHPL